MKSKMNIKSIIIMAIIGIISLFFINISLAADTAKIAVETANIRETADTTSKILVQISQGESVEILQKSGEWYEIKYNNVTGFVREDLLEIQTETTNKIEENNQTQTENPEKAETSEDEVKETEITLGKKYVAVDTNLKIVPTINSTNIVDVKKGDEVEVIEIINGWVCIEKGTIKGWIRAEKLKNEPEKVEEPEPEKEEQPPVQEQPQVSTTKTLFVNSASINLRKEANTSCEVLATLPVNTAVEVTSEENGWSKVKVNGMEGYISSSLLSTTKQETSRASETPRKPEQTTTNKVETTTNTTAEKPATNANGSSVVEKAKSYIGCKYVYGGSSPSGFDCSGFTSYIYKQFGVSLNRTAAGQYSNGVAVSRNNLQPGDLVMFGKSGINHVGIYIGGGQIVHAANSSRGVTTDTINSGYYNNNYVGARRVQ